MDERRKYQPFGELALLLNRFRSRDLRRGQSHLDLYLTNECDRDCRICYINSSPGQKNTRLGFNFVVNLIKDFKGVDCGTLTGGEVSILPYIKELILCGSRAFSTLFVQTNLIGFIDPKSFRSTNPVSSITQDLRNSFNYFPPNIEIVVPATEPHMLSELGGRKEHVLVVEAASLLAREWQDDVERPQIRFIVKNTPGDDTSGDRILKRFDLYGLAKTGMEAYPGNIVGNGRAKGMTGVKDPRDLMTTKSLDQLFEGGLAVNCKGVYVNEGPLLSDLLPEEMWGPWLVSTGKICNVDRVEYDSVKNSIREFLLNLD